MTEPDPGEAGSVLAGLPSTRPQRRSTKREPAAARPRARPESVPGPKSVPGPQSAAAPGSEPADPIPGRRARPPVAAQGFAPDTARGAVEPPSRADLLGAAAQGAGDLAHAGLDAGRHLFRAVLGRLTGL